MSGEKMLLLAIATALFWSSALGAEFIVGDSAGWTAPSNANISYAEWALKHRYHVGDTLVFKYSQDSHTVLKVNRQDFEACHTANSIAAYKDGESKVRLTNAGPHWFICGETSHCTQGQKFGIMVVSRKGHHRGMAPAPAPGPSSGADQTLPSPVEEETAPSTSPVAAPALAPSTGSAQSLANLPAALAACASIALAAALAL